ncbi:NADH-dependent flavin oxidoreductase [Lactococcus hircilactis]|nr:NADH-dependent flavin oxidoreductase [Lactococcus hircilactis]
MKDQFLIPFKFKNGALIKNRIVMAPMTEMSAFENGAITKDQLDYYAARSGGVGMEITACFNVSAQGKGFEGNPSAASDDMIIGMSKLAQVMKTNGTKAILQIFDAGRMTTSKLLKGKTPVSASAIKADRPGLEPPRALSNEEILTEIQAFAQATRRAILAGFDGVEIHGANTYLIQQFFSPHSNRRSDEWGGNLKNRMKFPLAVIEEVSKIAKTYAKSDFIIGYRISPEEVENPGIRIEETLTFIDQLAQSPLSYLHVSMGDVYRNSLNSPEDPEPINKKIQKRLAGRLPMIVVGGIEKPSEAQQVMTDGFEFVALGRALIREPKWVQKVIAEDEKSIRYTVSPTDVDDLAIPMPLWGFLSTVFKPIAGISTETSPEVNFTKAAAPWEKF